ncbi:TNF receptor-associated factor 6 [Bulinus truncatus]|nr:TNF receptor-associated factor 6 [Bulinus truncatus]
MQSPGDSLDVDAIADMNHGYDVQFLCEMESRLVCPICLLTMRNTVQTLCGHRFCEACIKRVIVDGSGVLTCPVDKTISKVEQMSPRGERSCACLSNARIRPKAAIGEESSLKCLLTRPVVWSSKIAPTVCTRFKRAETDQHMTQCPSRQVLCLFCSERVPHSKMIGHTEQCPKAPVACSVCGKDDLLREELSSHQDIDSGSAPSPSYPSIQLILGVRSRQSSEAVSLVMATQRSLTSADERAPRSQQAHRKAALEGQGWTAEVGTHEPATAAWHFTIGCPGYKV